jgi:hypothetical protein
MKCKKCQVFYWKHDDGWDVFFQSDGFQLDDQWIPDAFDCAILEDLPNKREAIKQTQRYQNETHPFGLCLK